MGGHREDSGHGIDVLLVADAASVHTRRLAAGLRDAGVRVGVAGFEGEPIDGVGLHRLGARGSRSDARYGLAVPTLARLIRRLRPRIVHGHYVSSYGLLAALASRAARLGGTRATLVQSAWGTDLLVTAAHSAVRREMARVALRPASLITGDSTDLLDAARSLAPTVDVLRFVWGPPRALAEAPRHPEKQVLSSRRLDPDMRVDLIVRAFLAAIELDPMTTAGWRLTVAGTGSERGAVHAAAGGSGRIVFVGQLGPGDLHARLLGSDIFVSIPPSDGTSAALMEAMAAGAMPVVSDLPANREWVDGTVGEIVGRHPDAAELAAALVRAMRRDVDPARIRARVADVAWEQQVVRLVQAYGTIGGVRPRTTDE